MCVCVFSRIMSMILSSLVDVVRCHENGAEVSCHGFVQVWMLQMPFPSLRQDAKLLVSKTHATSPLRNCHRLWPLPTWRPQLSSCSRGFVSASPLLLGVGQEAPKTRPQAHLALPAFEAKHLQAIMMCVAALLASRLKVSQASPRASRVI